MTPTPDDIRKARPTPADSDKAKDIAFDFDCDWSADGRRRGVEEEKDAVTAIANALRAEREAERERCARIAEYARLDWLGSHGTVSEMAFHIAASIRRSEP